VLHIGDKRFDCMEFQGGEEFYGHKLGRHNCLLDQHHLLGPGLGLDFSALV